MFAGGAVSLSVWPQCQAPV